MKLNGNELFFKDFDDFLVKSMIFEHLQEVVSRLPSGVGGRASTLNLSTHPENAFSGV